MAAIFDTPSEIALYIAAQMRAKRLAMNFSQKTLSAHAAISLGVLKKFEQTGKISLESLLKLALVLRKLEAFRSVFNEPPSTRFSSLDELLKDKKRQRGRQ